MNRIEKKFAALRREGRIAFMPFVVAGDPGFDTSIKVIKLLTRYADLLEIGFPYSDPLADGPIIQAADERALQAGMNTDKVFKLIRKIRSFSEVPITVLVYANLVEQRGVDRFYRDAKNAGVDGILIPDVPIEEIDSFIEQAKKVEVNQILMVSQTTNSDRLRKIVQLAKGYIYLVTVLGTTGARKKIEQATLTLIRRTKKAASLPLAVGFGISNKNHVKVLDRIGADGFIIGSRIIKIIEENLREPHNLYNRLRKYLDGITTKK